MDASRFDVFVKALRLNSGRRGVVSGLLGGGLSSLLAVVESEARRRANRRQGSAGLSAEKRKKCKKKKHKKCRKKPKPQGEAPPCTEASCPLPPECSQSAFDTCSAALIATVRAEIQACAPECATGDTPACRACLEPILAGHLSDVDECAAESCGVSVSRAFSGGRATAAEGRAAARLWWDRACGRLCCYTTWRGCLDDATSALADCLSDASICRFVPGTCTPAFAFCVSRYAYDRAKCNAQYGCTDGSESCGKGDICCQRGYKPCGGGCCPTGHACCGEECVPTSGTSLTPCGDTCCDLSHQTCCFNKWCCSEPGAPCCKTTGGEEYCCVPTLACKQTGGPTCQSG